MANPSLAMIPSGYKAGKLYSVLPKDGTGDFTVARNSVATRVNENGVIEEVAANVPRLDYSDGGCPVLNLEPQSTNLVETNNSLATYWIKGNSTTQDNTVISPDGTQNAHTITDDATNDYHYIWQQPCPRDSQNYARSVYVKKGTWRYIWLSVNFESSSVVNTWIFDLDNGIYTQEGSAGTTLDVEEHINGWFRIGIVNVSTSTSNDDISIGFSPLPTGSGASLQYTGVGDTIHIWRPQVELGDIATSVITTSGTTVTRLQDEVTGAGDVNTFNSEEGVLFVEWNSIFINTDRWIVISDGSISNRIVLYLSASNNLRAFVSVGGVPQVDMNYAGYGDNSIEKKVAFQWKSNKYKLFVDGVEVLNDSSALIFPINTLNKLNLSNSLGSTNNFNGKIKQLKVYKSIQDAIDDGIIPS